MGAGHDGAARELARRLTETGHEARVVDLFDAAPRPLVWLWRETYRWQLRFAPSLYERAYQLYYRPSRSWPWVLRFVDRLTGRTIDRWVRETGADTVVSTYALATLVLGSRRARGRLAPRLVNFLTDFGVHPRTVHEAVDLHLAVHDVSAAAARALVRAPVVTSGPAVAPTIPRAAGDRAAARRRLGLPLDAAVVLVVAGSWGVGEDLGGTVRALAADGRFTVCTLCGRDDTLRTALERAGAGRAVGWTDQVPAYLAAADVLVENAGGLTAMEAFAAEVPVVSYRPIPGHGRDNVRAMVQAGVSASPTDIAELCAVVADLASDSPARAAQLAAAQEVFRTDPAAVIIDFVDGTASLGDA
jgi:processive 1,2-diacylglycerol beta-glucosyltransferase